MAGFPIWQTDAEAGRDIPVGAFLLAAGVAIALPSGLGFVTMRTISALELDAAGLASLAYVMTLSPILSWLGVIPGAVLARVMMRHGVGGVFAILVMAAGLGIVLTGLVYGGGHLRRPILALVGLPYALILWLTIYLPHRSRLVAH